MIGPSDTPVIEDSVLYMQRDWRREMELPNVLEIDGCNRGALAQAPCVTGWLQVDTRQRFDGYSVDFKADRLPAGTFCAPAGLDLEYSSLTGAYGQYESIRKHAGTCVLAGLAKGEDGGTYAELTLWNAACTDFQGRTTVVSPRRLYPVVAETDAACDGKRVVCQRRYVWEPERWYRMHLSCRSASKTQNTILELWICDLGTGMWTLLFRYDLGLPGIRFMNRVSVCLDNTLLQRSGDVRTLEFRNAFVHGSDGKWQMLTTAAFIPADDRRGSYRFGTDGRMFYMITTGVPGKAGTPQPAQRLTLKQDPVSGSGGTGGTTGAGMGREGTMTPREPVEKSKNKKNPSCLTVLLVLAGLFLLVRWLGSSSKAGKTASAAATPQPTAVTWVKPKATATARPKATGTRRPTAAATARPIPTLAPLPTAAPTPVETYDWDLFPELGSAYKLSGRNIVISIYLSDAEYDWRWVEDQGREQDNRTAHNHLNYISVACGWLIEQAQRYGYDPGFFYDWTKHPDLFYELKLPYRAIDPQGSVAGGLTREAYRDMEEFIHDKIDNDALLREYAAGNIIYLFFINNPTGQEMRSHANTVWKRLYKPTYPYEYCVLYNHQYQYELFPATIAHEMLHCYGARDLYVSNSDEITPQYAEYMYLNRSYDIMCNTFDPQTGYVYYDRIVQFLSDVDAYYMGLTNYSSDVVRWSLGPSDFE